MKIALISDIHSNLFYLEEILKRIEDENVDAVYCLGDLVGYYDSPNEVINVIREKKIVCIKGNHDKYLLNELTYDISRENIYRIKMQRKILSNENLDFLRNLKDEIVLEVDNKKVYMTHSLPNDSEKYLYQIDNLNREFVSKYDYYFFGHTHIPMITYYYGTCIVNPGSVGQPRDYTDSPSYAVIDFNNDLVKIQKIKINKNEYLKKLKNNSFDERLINILQRGKRWKKLMF